MSRASKQTRSVSDTNPLFGTAIEPVFQLNASYNPLNPHTHTHTQDKTRDDRHKTTHKTKRWTTDKIKHKITHIHKTYTSRDNDTTRHFVVCATRRTCPYPDVEFDVLV